LTVERLQAQLGPWEVAGPALEYGIRALADSGWQAEMRRRLAEDAARLDALFGRFGIPVAGGTTLFRYLQLPGAAVLFSALGERGIVLRHFSDRPHVLRVGLPGCDEEWQRLQSALADRASQRDDQAKET
jgi:cobalamin biosynthetic protein CobC